MITPLPNDVIFGRGFSILNRPGNKTYQSSIKFLKPKYDASPKSLKANCAHKVIEVIYNLTPPGRFLTKDKDSGAWKEVGKELAVRKARQALRDTKLPLADVPAGNLQLLPEKNGCDSTPSEEETHCFEEQREKFQGKSENANTRHSNSTTSPARAGRGTRGGVKEEPRAIVQLHVREDAPFVSDAPSSSEETASTGREPSKTTKIGRAAMLTRRTSLRVAYNSASALMSIKEFSWDSDDTDSPVPSPLKEDGGDDAPGGQGWGRSRTQLPPHEHRAVYHPNAVTGSSTSMLLTADLPREHSFVGNPLPLASTGEPPPTGSFLSRETPRTFPTMYPDNGSEWTHPLPLSQRSLSNSDEKRQEWTTHGYGYQGEGYYTRQQTGSAKNNDYQSSSSATDTSIFKEDINAHHWRSGSDNGGSNNNFLNHWDGYSNACQNTPNGVASYDDGAMYKHTTHDRHQSWLTPPNDHIMYPDHTHHTQTPMYQSQGISHGSSLSHTNSRPRPIKRETSHKNENSETKSHIKRINRQRSTGNIRDIPMSPIIATTRRRADTMQNLEINLHQSTIGANDKDANSCSLKKPNAMSLHDGK